MESNVLKEIILTGTSDLDIYGYEGFEGLKYAIYKPTKDHDIFNEGLPVKEQKWKRPEFPDFSTLSRQQCQDLYIRELKRIKNGIYIWIGGTLEYITGKHYFGLTHWRLRESSTEYMIYTQTQRDLFYMFDLCEKDPKCAGAIIFSLKRLGKALDVNTLIPTINGWKKMLDIQEGDSVFGSDGKPTKVVWVSHIQHNRDCYKITFDGDEEVVADAEHKWIVSDAIQRAAQSPSSQYKLDSIGTQIRTTKELFDNQKSKQGNSNWSISNANPIEYEQKELKIPPYILGLWIGDGTSRATAITNPEPEIIKSWLDYGKSIDLEYFNDKPITYFLSSGRSQKDRSNKGRNKMLSALQDYNLINNKHIPKDYMESSFEDRLELLRGIMDTDGYVIKGSNACEISSKWEHLRDEYYDLVCSLGMKAKKRNKLNKKLNRYYYYLYFSPHEHNPFNLPRKRDKIDLSKTAGISKKYRYIKSIEKVDSVPVKCIAVDNKDHSYLCTNSYIVTHNSETAQIEMFSDAMITDSGRYIVQALNDDEAVDIFGKTQYANELLHNSLPVWSNKMSISKTGKPPENLIGLRRESKKDEIAWKSADGIEGSNQVSFSVKPTKLAGIQGKKIKRAFLDEFASLKPVKDMTLKNYHAKAIAQVTEDFGSLVLGKVWLIATAENLESESLVDAQTIWDNSDPSKRNANGFTNSKLYRMFIPYYLGGRSADYIDEFGRPRIDEAKRFYQNTLETLSDSEKLIFRRQNPETIKDVFEIEVEGGLEADVMEILKERRKELLMKRTPQPLYNIKMYNKEIILEPTKTEGQFTIEMFEPPEQHHSYRIGLDATSTAENSTNKNSKGGEYGKEKSKFAVVVHKVTGDNQYVDVANLFIRPEKRHLVEKAAMWLCMYYNKYGGCRAYPERNASAGSTLTDLFEAEGQQRILIRQLKKHNTDKLMEKSTDAYGIYIDGNNKDYRTSVMNKYLRLHGHKINSVRIIDNLLIYGLKNSDLADAYGVGTMACGNFDPEKEVKKTITSRVIYENVLNSDGSFIRRKKIVNA